jgi:hypothetical protein
MTTNNTNEHAVIEPKSADTQMAVVDAPATEVEITQTTVNFIPVEDIPDMETMNPGVSLRMTYMEFEQVGTKVRCVYVGMTTMPNGKGKMIPAAVFQTRERAFVNAGANLLSQVRVVPIGTAIEIEYTGKEKTQSGNNVKVFEVRVLSSRKAAEVAVPATA